MPHKSGVELCAEIRELDDYLSVPIIMLTAMHEEDFIEQAFRAEANDYLTRPFDIAQVGLRIRHVGLKNTQDANARSATSIETQTAVAFEDPVALVGVGVFVFNSAAVHTRSAIDMETEIQDILDDRNLTFETDDPIDSDIAVGTSVVALPNAEISLGDLQSRAISRVDARVKQLLGVPRQVGIRRITP